MFVTGVFMKEWEIRVKEKDKWVSIGVFNKMQTQETLLEYMKTKFSIMLVPIKKEK